MTDILARLRAAQALVAQMDSARLWGEFVRAADAANAAAIALIRSPDFAGLVERCEAAEGELWNACQMREAAEAKLAAAEADAGRYRWLRARLIGANFAYDAGGESPESVLIFMWPDNARISANLDASIDAARAVP